MTVETRSGETLQSVRPQQMALNLTHAHAARVHADDVVIEAGQPALILADQLRLEARLAIARNVQLQFAVGRQNRLGARAVVVIARLALPALALQMVAQLGREHALGRLLLELTGKTGFAQDRLGILALHLGKQLVDQFVGEQFRGPRGLALLGMVASVMLFPLSSHDLGTRKIGQALARADRFFFSFDQPTVKPPTALPVVRRLRRPRPLRLITTG